MLSLDEGSSMIFHGTVLFRVTAVATGVKVATLATVSSPCLTFVRRMNLLT